MIKQLLIFLILFLGEVSLLKAQSGIYVGGHFRRERNHTINDLKTSGFTYVILFNVNVETNGDLTVDGETICKNGVYVFGATNPNYVADVTALKQGVTSINRVEFCIGGWGNHSYANIRTLISAQGTGTGSILYRNFKALKNAIPSVDAINNDDEEAYDVNSATSFHVMMSDIGYRTTLAPYMNRGFWQSLATNVNNQRGGAVDKIYLQWYEGGAGNNPCDWRLNNIEMHTGDLYYENATTANNKMISAKNNCGAKGGFFWVYNDNNINLKDLAGRVNTIYKPAINASTGLITTFKDINYTGFSGGFTIGDYNLDALKALGVEDNSITSLKVAQGYKVILYFDDNFTGQSVEITSDNGFVGNFNDQVTSLRVRANGITNVAGTYFLQNRNSGLNMDVWGISTTDGANIAQGTPHTGTNQQFKFSHLGDGVYQILAVHSGKSIDIDAIKTNNGANVQQWTYFGSANQQFIVVPTDLSGCYKLIAKHSGKVVEVAGASTANGANVQQWDNNNQTCGQWKFVPVVVGPPADGNGTGLTGNYFNGMNFETPVYSRTDATINVDWGGGSPNAAVNADQFSARWSGQVQPKYSGEYTFFVNSDNGRRLWVNGQLVIDKWIDDWNIDYSGKITLTAGQKYDIKLEYFENNGGAGAKLEWSHASQTRQVIPQTQLYVNALPTVSITSPGNNASFTTAANIAITASASDNGSISKIEFYNGTTKLGEDVTSPYALTWNNVGVGTYNITTRATDNQGGINVSSIVIVKVTTAAPVNQAPSISLTSPTNNTASTAPASITITANASDADGTISKVEFYNGTTLLNSDASAPYSFAWTNLGAGTYTITAKAFDNSNSNTTSAAVTVKVNPVVVTDQCSGLPTYVENAGYVAGSKVKNASKRYECKEYPYSGWCNGAAWAYGPGTGAYWTDAWYDRGACNARMSSNSTSENIVLAPNPTTGMLSIQLEQSSTIAVYNTLGTEVISSTRIVGNSTLDLSHLPIGIYLVKIDNGIDLITQTVLKK